MGEPGPRQPRCLAIRDEHPKLADQFKHLKALIITTMDDIHDKLMAVAKLSLRLNLRIANLFGDPAEQPSPDEAKPVFKKMVHNAKAYDAIVAEEGIHTSRRPMLEAAHLRRRSMHVSDCCPACKPES